MLRVSKAMVELDRRRRTASSDAGAAAAAQWEGRAHLRRPARSWVPSVFVVFSLLMLLAVPVWLERRTSAVRAEVLQPAQEARGVVNDVRQALSEAEASYRGFLLTGEDRFRDAMTRAHAAEARAFEELRTHARQLDPILVDQVERLRARSLAAQQRRLGTSAGPAVEPLRALAAHAQLLAASEEVRTAIIQHVEQARARIRALERTGVLIMMGLGVLALSAAVLVIITAHRDRRTALLEAELRAAALTLAEATEVEDILSRIVASAARTVPGASSFVERVDADRRDVMVVTTAGSYVLPKGTRVPFPGSVTEAAMRSGMPEQFLVATMTERPSATRLKEVCRDCAGVVVPLISDHDPQGALILLRPGRRSFRPREILQLRIFGVFAALALRKGVLLARALEQQRELQRTAHTRDRMVRGFSHDLKNPLGAADGHAALLDELVVGELTPEQHDSVRRIRDSLRSALHIIDDVVELAQAEAGQLTIRRTRVDPAALVSEVAREYGATAEAAGLELVETVAPGIPSIRTDPRRVRQILGNLMSNAIKYTPPGGRVRLWADERAGQPSTNSRWLAFGVEDSGPGIAPDDVPRLFQEFQRMDTGTAHGVGLGLAISERVARLLGGEIEVQSEVGQGSTFTLRLPCRREEGREAA